MRWTVIEDLKRAAIAAAAAAAVAAALAAAIPGARAADIKGWKAKTAGELGIDRPHGGIFERITAKK